jgi:hypothetical protein
MVLLDERASKSAKAGDSGAILPPSMRRVMLGVVVRASMCISRPMSDVRKCGGVAGSAVETDLIDGAGGDLCVMERREQQKRWGDALPTRDSRENTSREER